MDEKKHRKQLATASAIAWDRLYSSTGDSVWGKAPVAFLAEFLPAIREALLHHRRWILDAGSGEGRNLGPLHELGAQLCAVDSSLHALSKMAPALLRETAVVQADLAAMPFLTGSFQAAFLIDVIETMPDPQLVLAELHRILAPAGVLVTNIPSYDDSVAGVDMTPADNGGFLYKKRFYYRFFSREGACDLLKGLGFRILRINQYRWVEPPHPGFREYPHEHVSWVLLTQKYPGRQI